MPASENCSGFACAVDFFFSRQGTFSAKMSLVANVPHPSFTAKMSGHSTSGKGKNGSQLLVVHCVLSEFWLECV